MSAKKIKGTDEAWESGELGRDFDHAAHAPDDLEKQIDESLGLQAISIRLDKDLIESFKFIAKIEGMGYQPLMREALKRFATSEMKRLAIRMDAQLREMKRASDPAPPPEKKAA